MQVLRIALYWKLVINNRHCVCVMASIVCEYVTGFEKTTLIARVVLCSSGGFKANTVALSISGFFRILVPPSIV